MLDVARIVIIVCTLVDECYMYSECLSDTILVLHWSWSGMVQAGAHHQVEGGRPRVGSFSLQ
jgi:hypothetical protein